MISRTCEGRSTILGQSSLVLEICRYELKGPSTTVIFKQILPDSNGLFLFYTKILVKTEYPGIIDTSNNHFFMNTQAHSHEFIEEMKQRLLEEKKQLSKGLDNLAHKENGDFQANFPEYGRNEEENVTEMADYAALNATTEAAETRLKEVDDALRSIAEGTYGVTKNGEMIPEDRLRANPAANTLAQ